jgi:hypothetical protein
MEMESIIKFAQEHADLICTRAAREIQAGIEAYAEVPVHQLVPRLKSVLEKQLQYLKHSDTEEWTKASVQIVESRMEQGASAWDLIRAGQIMLQILGEFFDSELSKLKSIESKDVPKIKRRLKARIEGMNAVATAVATNVGAKHVNKAQPRAAALRPARRGPTGGTR